jgi:hypothetical protein
MTGYVFANGAKLFMKLRDMEFHACDQHGSTMRIRTFHLISSCLLASTSKWAVSTVAISDLFKNAALHDRYGNAII